MLGEDPELAATLVERSLNWLDESGHDIDAISLSIKFLDRRTSVLLIAQYVLRHRLEGNLDEQLGDLARLMPAAAWLPQVLQTFTTPAPMHLFIPSSVLLRLTDPLLGLEREGRLIWGLLQLALASTQSYAVGFLDDILDAIADAETAGDDMAMLSLRAAIAVEKGLYLAHTGDVAEGLPSLLAGSEYARITKQDYYRSLGLGASAWAYSLLGYADNVRFQANACLALSTEMGFGSTSGTDYAHLALAEIAVEDGNLDGALAHMARCRPILWGEQETFPIRTATKATIDLLQGNVIEVLATVDSASNSSAAFTDYHKLLVYSHRVYAYLLTEDLEDAERAHAALKPAEPGNELGDTYAIMTARVYLVAGRYQEAIDVLQPLTDAALEARTPYKGMLYGLLFQAEACSALERHEEAADLRRRSKIIAGRLGIDNAGARHRTLHTLKSQADPLTETEMKVLGALDSADSLNSIAEKLYISINTLKTHTRRIYRKLNVTSRDEAVERGYVLHLLPLNERGNLSDCRHARCLLCRPCWWTLRRVCARCRRRCRRDHSRFWAAQSHRFDVHHHRGPLGRVLRRRQGLLRGHGGVRHAHIARPEGRYQARLRGRDDWQTDASRGGSRRTPRGLITARFDWWDAPPRQLAGKRLQRRITPVSLACRCRHLEVAARRNL